MPRTVNMHEAKTRLSQLVARAEAGEDVVISRAGKPVARLTGLQKRTPAQFGFAKGTVKIRGDLTDSLPQQVLDSFYNSPNFQQRPQAKGKPPTRGKAKGSH